MFRRSRAKIILAIMGSLVLLFTVTLSVILLASYHGVRQENMDMLRRHVELDILGREPERAGDPGPKGPPDDRDGAFRGPPRGPLDQRADYRLSTFYSVSFDESGAVTEVDDGDLDLYSEEDLTRIAGEILSSGRSSGRTGNLTYIVTRSPEGILVSFMDNTVSESGLNTLLKNVLIVGGAAMIVMFFVSLFLSGRIIRPLEENDRRQKRFISDASHELKTPVAVIGTNAEMLESEIGANEWLNNIRYENGRMGDLIRQLLDLSRAESAELPAETVDFSSVVTGEALAFEALAFDQGRVIVSDIEDGIRVTGSRAQLTQIVSVLLDNAVRHASGSDIGLSLKAHGHSAVLTVTNDGEKIPPDKMERLFDRFYRADEARQDDGHHYGLGLSIAKAAAEKHGGGITAACRDGKVIFTVTLPVKN